MERKSIGSFIAALRRANGLTQQELADKLNVSNKAVSRWERDETLPDLTLIPAIAEIFGVTCDEILRGERKAMPEAMPAGNAEEDHEAAARAEARAAQKSERRAAAIVDRALSKFRTQTVISLALIVVGVLVMFLVGMFFQGGVTVIGIVCMLIFDVAAVVVTMISVMRLRESCGGEVAESCGSDTVARYERTMVRWSYAVYAVLFVILWMLFALCFLNVTERVAFSDNHIETLTPDGTEWTITDDVYVGEMTVTYGPDVATMLFLLLCPVAILILLYKPYAALVTVKRVPARETDAESGRFRIASAILGALSVLSVLAERILWAVLEHNDKWSVLTDIMNWISIIFFLAVIVANVVFVIKRRGRRLETVLHGIRSVLMTIGALAIASAYSISIFYESGARYQYLDRRETMIGLTIILVTAAVYRIIADRTAER